ncbi:hypothetical protein BDV38DRAFT_257610 [Aspergillus pseudotamarii]|uniref:Uncharacterized protein n=1 Tax=Aspergillus pseudotamarii TaxID=132259 RepID=A0A5N6SIS5_ASPPS|nr:uncharacterized protein BDV38DRAFT_257610 [Aspergillus pseudotamarii]KAE8133650.1 hypothetical protein BDV38DRAFT_257610 [Aspergillus pseudotamarii]
MRGRSTVCCQFIFRLNAVSCERYPPETLDRFAGRSLHAAGCRHAIHDLRFIYTPPAIISWYLIITLLGYA